MSSLPNGNCKGHVSPTPCETSQKPDVCQMGLCDAALLDSLRAEATRVEAITREMARQLREMRERR
jgi:hypothetical protein